MLKKVFSGIISVIMLFLLLPMTGIAASTDITNLDVQTNGISIGTFYPGNGETATISFTLAQNLDITANVMNSSNTVVATLATLENKNAGSHSYVWYGKTGNTSSGGVLPAGNYSVNVFGYDPANNANLIDFDTTTVTLDPTVSASFTLSSFTSVASGGGSFDPAPSGDNETLNMNYTFSSQADSVDVWIKDDDDKTLKTFTATSISSGTFTWDGKYSSKLVDPGIYSVVLSASKSGHTALTQTNTITVAYSDPSKPLITSLDVSPSSFDPDFEDAEISFTNSETAYITVEIQESDGDRIRDFDDYKHDSFSSNEDHTVVWNGDDNTSNEVAIGTYYVYVRAENDYGVSFVETNVTADNSLGSLSSSNSHIDDISFSPSTFEPAEDDEVEIEFDVRRDLDELRITANQGTREIEIFDESNIDEESNFQVLWDGTDDDDEYADDGTWTIIFESKVGSTTLEAAKTLNIEYEKPNIDDLYLSKEKFDNDIGEFTYVMFRVDANADVDIFVYEDGDEDDDIIEDLEVEADKWYAVEWDGGNYDYDDDIDIKVIAKNTVNEDISDSEKISVDLAEDDVSSSKSNVTEDYVAPVISDGNDSISLFYDLEVDADIVISIHKGTSSSGSEVIELLDLLNQDGGGHEIFWDGKDDDGDKLSKGIYTYKIVSNLDRSETETGHFIIGEVGDIDGGSSSSTSSSSQNDNIHPNVIVDGNTSNIIDSGVSCGGFSDVSTNSEYCEAITWARSEGFILGYSDNTFKPNDPINRVELLKVILESYNATILPDDGTNQSFIDVSIGAWYMPYIRTGKNLGVFHGDVGYSTARPGDTVNRVEALKIIFETLDAQNGYILGSCTSNYGDIPSYAWYYDYACESKRYNLYVGLDLYPSQDSTRGEIALVLYKLHNAGVI